MISSTPAEHKPGIRQQRAELLLERNGIAVTGLCGWCAGHFGRVRIHSLLKRLGNCLQLRHARLRSLSRTYLYFDAASCLGLGFHDGAPADVVRLTRALPRRRRLRLSGTELQLQLVHALLRRLPFAILLQQLRLRAGQLVLRLRLRAHAVPRRHLLRNSHLLHVSRSRGLEPGCLLLQERALCLQRLQLLSARRQLGLRRLHLARRLRLHFHHVTLHRRFQSAQSLLRSRLLRARLPHLILQLTVAQQGLLESPRLGGQLGLHGGQLACGGGLHLHHVSARHALQVLAMLPCSVGLRLQMLRSSLQRCDALCALLPKLIGVLELALHGCNGAGRCLLGYLLPLPRVQTRLFQPLLILLVSRVKGGARLGLGWGGRRPQSRLQVRHLAPQLLHCIRILAVVAFAAVGDWFGRGRRRGAWRFALGHGCSGGGRLHDCMGGAGRVQDVHRSTPGGRGGGGRGVSGCRCRGHCQGRGSGAVCCLVLVPEGGVALSEPRGQVERLGAVLFLCTASWCAGGLGDLFLIHWSFCGRH
mmetsp:Transcript_16661/g.32197  ORF Transcript_16661/g.32197 Transcript_16661/m.32197 type:complete len:531 (-) Transcript_16661:256-1848(-)